MTKQKKKAGRPPRFKTPEELQEKVDEYKQHCKDEEELPSFAGLATFIGMDRQSVYDYENREEFSDTIKHVRVYIQKEWIQLLGTKASTGAIFMLKNFGWSDKQEHEVTQREFEVGIEPSEN